MSKHDLMHASTLLLVERGSRLEQQNEGLRRIIEGHHKWRIENDSDIFEAYRDSQLYALSETALRQIPPLDEYGVGSRLRVKPDQGQAAIAVVPTQVWAVVWATQLARTERLLRLEGSGEPGRHMVLDVVELAERFDVIEAEPSEREALALQAEKALGIERLPAEPPVCRVCLGKRTVMTAGMKFCKDCPECCGEEG